MVWLLIAHVAAMGAWAWFVAWQIRVDVRAFAADGAKDSLHGAFHAQRLFYRLMVAATLSFVASLPLWRHDGAMAGAMAGLYVLLLCYFGFAFNPGLSKARGLDPYYVSADPRAAYFPDRLLWGWASKVFPATLLVDDPTLLRMRTKLAALDLRRLLKVVMAAGLLAEAAGLWAAAHFLAP